MGVEQALILKKIKLNQFVQFNLYFSLFQLFTLAILFLSLEAGVMTYILGGSFLFNFFVISLPLMSYLRMKKNLKYIGPYLRKKFFWGLFVQVGVVIFSVLILNSI